MHPAKLYWSKIPKEVRSARARKAALARHAKTTPQQKSEQMTRVVKARWAKRNLTQS